MNFRYFILVNFHFFKINFSHLDKFKIVVALIDRTLVSFMRNVRDVNSSPLK